MIDKLVYHINFFNCIKIFEKHIGGDWFRQGTSRLDKHTGEITCPVIEW